MICSYLCTERQWKFKCFTGSLTLPEPQRYLHEAQCFQEAQGLWCHSTNAALSPEPQRHPSKGSTALKSLEGGVGCCDSQINTAAATVNQDTRATHFGKEVLALKFNDNWLASAPDFLCPRDGERETDPKQALTPCYQAPSERSYPGKKTAVKLSESPTGPALGIFSPQAKHWGSSCWPPYVKSSGHLEVRSARGLQREAWVLSIFLESYIVK